MTTVNCHYANGETITTSINGTYEEIHSYFVGNVFNIGTTTDNLQQCIDIELI